MILLEAVGTHHEVADFQSNNRALTCWTAGQMNQTACGHPTLKDGVCFGPHALTLGFMESRNRRVFVAQIPLIRTIESLLSVSSEIP
jgi:hypothetical protein